MALGIRRPVFVTVVAVAVTLAPVMAKGKLASKYSRGAMCTSMNLECVGTDGKWSQVYQGTHNNEGCRRRCLESERCTMWTWYRMDNNGTPYVCQLHQECSLQPYHCSHCYSGPPCYDGPSSLASTAVILGGLDCNGTGVTTVDVYLTTHNASSNVIPAISKDMAFENSAATFLLSKIYVCGGNDMKVVSSDCIFLDLLRPSLEWRTDMPSMAFKRTDATALSAYGEVYVMGGTSDPFRSILDSVEVYNPEERTWREIYKMPRGLRGHCSVLKKDIIYVIGGQSGFSGQDDNSVDHLSMDTYNITSTRWTSTTFQDARNRMNHACILLNETVWITGGISLWDQRVMKETLTLNTRTRTVQKMPDMTKPRANHGLAEYGGMPYAIGGQDGDQETLTANEIFDGETWMAEEVPTLGRSHFGLVQTHIQYL